MKRQQKIFAFHLLNDRSGSPKVLAQLLNSWVNNYDVKLYTSVHQQGFLSNIKGVEYYNGWYRFKKNTILRLAFYTLSQVILFFKMFSKINKKDIIYINTVLPFGAACIGKLKGCRVIYHVHESTVNPPILKWFLFSMVNSTASDVINVSKYVQYSHSLTKPTNHLVYNSIDSSFLKKINSTDSIKESPSNVLMLCSFKLYKGINEFISLAKNNYNYNFRLVLNARLEEITTFIETNRDIKNLEIFPSQKNVHPFYNWADVILNLSRPDGWVETFGLTIIEGMAYKLPAIVPPVGGILEVIEDGVSGFAVDSRDDVQLNLKLNEILKNKNTYISFSEAAYNRLSLFKA